MLRIIGILTFIALVSLGMAQIADTPGRAAIDWSDYHIEMPLLFLVASLAGFALCCMLLYAVFYMLLSTPRNWLRSRSEKRSQRGLYLLTETFASIAAGDISLASQKLVQAKRYMPDQPITLMLSAQIARAEGNETAARTYIEQMLGNEATEFIALRSLIEAALRNGNDALAIQYGEKAISVKPADNWIIITLCELYGRNGRVQDATRILALSFRKGYINRSVFRCQSAGLALWNAKLLFADRRYDSAIAEIKIALKKMPDFPAASSLLAEIYTVKDDIKTACKVIYRAWKISPSAELREALLKVLAKYHNRQKFIAFAHKIVRLHPDHAETRLLASEIQSLDLH